MDISSPVSMIKGVGPALEAVLADLKIFTVGDLVNYYPRKYEDYSSIQEIKNIKPGPVTISGVIKQVKGRYVRRGMHVTEAIASDKSGSVRLVWFNQPYRSASIKSGQNYFISGNFELSHQKMAIMNPGMEAESDFPVNTARIIPIYKEAKGIKSTQIRKIIREIAPIIGRMPETLPDWIIQKEKLISRGDAILALHFPEDKTILDKARHRLGFEEVFQLTLAALLNKEEVTHDHSLKINFNKDLARQFVSNLPFTLTDDQRRVIWQLYQDMKSDTPMNRLVEGDVGSGKTVVATMTALMAMEQGYQVAFMAPTELLAKQHAETIYNLLTPLGFHDQVSLLVGSLKPKQKEKAREMIKNGSVRFIIGTHALIQEKVDLHKLGLVIIDEQHRFGVEQRKKLQIKAGHMPHVLSMTATPIPRSLALTLYGEMDISVIATKPSNRLPIKTKLVSPNSLAPMYKDITKQIDKGRQVFVVCPLVGESQALKDVKSAEKVYEELRKKEFKNYKVGLLHGKMKADQKSAVMQDFINKKYDVLVSTTVIEVGVDVPNATVMIIENADRFGLAQLHQLRGRVGRSSHQGYCYAVLSDSKPPTKRLRAFEQTNDGFKLSELDLEIRGPGAIYGTLQHGQLDLKIATLGDTKLIASARSIAAMFIKKQEKLVQYKQLAKQVAKYQAITSLN